MVKLILTTILCLYVGFFFIPFHISKAKCVLADNSILSHILFFVRYMYHIYDKNVLKLGMAVTKDMINVTKDKRIQYIYLQMFIPSLFGLQTPYKHIFTTKDIFTRQVLFI